MSRQMLLVLALVAFATPADALVMCGPKKPDGSLREGAAVKLRSACKPNEVVVDPVALGLQGPPGVGAAILTDSTAARIGVVVAWPDLIYLEDVVVRGVTMPLVILASSVEGFPAASLKFETTDCSGQPLLDAQFPLEKYQRADGALGPPSGAGSIAGPGTLIYYAAGTPETRVIASVKTATSEAVCADHPGGVFTPPNTCCYPVAGGPEPRQSAAVGTVPVGAFVPPFKLAVTP